MRSKKELLKDWKLYVLTDKASLKGRNVVDAVRQAVAGGASVVQLRDKTASVAERVELARAMLAYTRPAGVPLIINDSIEVALGSGADGVHLGQTDGPLAAARLALGPEAIIGRSTHSPEQGLAAVDEGFDYIGVGPVYATPTKPTYRPVGLDYVSFAAKNIRIPFVAIGGIDRSNVADVLAAGAGCFAVVRAVMASDDIESAVRGFREAVRR